MRSAFLVSLLRAAAVVSFVAMGLTASSAAAEQATLQIKNGQKYSGELLEYVPGDHVTLGVAPGKNLRFAASDLVSFDIGKPAAAPAPAKPVAAPAAPAQRVVATPQPTAAKPAARQMPKEQARLGEGGPAPEGPSALVRAAAVHALLNERAAWQARDTNLAAPVLFTLVGVIATSVGVGLQVAYQNSDRDVLPHPSDEPPMRRKNAELNAASLMTFITGSVLLGSGFALFLTRTSDAHRDRELERIDTQLQGYGVQANVTPWVLPSSGSARGLSAGLDLHVSM